MIRTLQPIPFIKLRGLLAINYGFKTETTRGYLKELKDAEYINVEQGIVNIAPAQEQKIKKEIQKSEVELDDYDKKLQGAEAG